ncbi:hypothetical protein KXX29_002543 [Aspergillus fumigatus]|nr:hypothetical protein KXX29_002543 [Aspergillus fumigatus]
MGRQCPCHWPLSLRLSLLLSLLLLPLRATTLDLNVTDPDNIKEVASQLAWDLVSFYTGNNTGDVPGNLPAPYYWWEAGAFFGTLVNYWRYTGDDTYNNITMQAILHQAGTGDFMPSNQTRTEGNDDQAFWAFTALMAAEHNFPTHPRTRRRGWPWRERSSMSRSRAGTIRPIFPFNNGYTYRNSISNGGLFNIAARLARYTGDATDNCSALNRVEWTYNNGVFLHGAAHMWNYTQGNSSWKARIDGLLDAQRTFLSPNKSSENVLYEYACETINTCRTDQYSFKAYLARWMGDVAQLAPWTRDTIATRLRASATAAAAQCVGGKTGTYCGGMRWTTGEYDGTTGVGQQLSALEVVQANLYNTVAGPLTTSTGGTSKRNSAVERGSSERIAVSDDSSIVTMADRVVAWVATGGLGVLLGGYLYLVVT